MAYVTNDGARIRYETDGDGPAVVFCGDAGLGAWQFGWQHGAVAGPYTAVTIEPRGVGDSDPPDGPLDAATLATDVDAVLAEEGIRKAHLVGYGLGGMVAQAYALASSRPRSLFLVGTAATGDAYDPEAVWADPDEPAAVHASLEAAFSPDFRERHPDVLDRIADWRIAEDAAPETFAAHRAAVDAFDVGDRLHELTTPALVVHGDADDACPPHYGEALAEGLPRGEFRSVEAGHLAGIEASAAVNDELRGWLDARTEA